MAFETTYRVTQFFLDRAELRRKIDAARLRMLSRQGAFVRRRAKTNILRRRKAVSQPGSPPSVRSRDNVATLKNILFFLDPRTETVVVGPVKLNQFNRGSTGSSVSVPSLLEFGGSVRIAEERYLGYRTWYRRDMRRKQSPHKLYRTRLAKYRARPFMGPSLQAEIKAGTIVESWRNAVRG